jgi:hypothetical protein
MKKLSTVLVMSLFTLVVNAASAHGGAEPKHGGVVQAAGALSFEPTARDNGATIYIEDHGEPLSTAGMTGRLTVLYGGERSDAELKPSGENRLEAEGVNIIRGSRAVAAVKSAEGAALTVGFSVK